MFTKITLHFNHLSPSRSIGKFPILLLTFECDTIPNRNTRRRVQSSLWVLVTTSSISLQSLPRLTSRYKLPSLTDQSILFERPCWPCVRRLVSGVVVIVRRSILIILVGDIIRAGTCGSICHNTPGCLNTPGDSGGLRRKGITCNFNC